MVCAGNTDEMREEMEERIIEEIEQKQRKNFMGIIISPRSGLSDRKQDLVFAGYQCI